MSTLLDELSQLISALDENEIEYAVCGGLALTVHGFPRARYGIDVLILPQSLEKVYEITAKNGYDVRGLEELYNEKAVEIRRVSKIDDDGEVLPLKFLLVTPPLENVWDEREKLTWQNRDLWIVSRMGLIKMKNLSGRLQDAADVERLENEES